MSSRASGYPTYTQSGLLVLLGLISVALVIGAVAIQIFGGQDPCPLCIVLRYLFLLIAIAAFAGALVRKRGGRVGVALFILVVSLAGAAVSGRLVYLEFNPFASCGRDVVQLWTDAIPLAQWWPTVFQATGMCGTAYPPIFGLSLAEWSLVACVAVALCVAIGLWRARRM
ncbi:disulfide bond formation protein B [Pseudomonas sp. Marseille-QA0892]